MRHKRKVEDVRQRVAKIKWSSQVLTLDKMIIGGITLYDNGDHGLDREQGATPDKLWRRHKKDRGNRLETKIGQN